MSPAQRFENLPVSMHTVLTISATVVAVAASYFSMVSKVDAAAKAVETLRTETAAQYVKLERRAEKDSARIDALTLQVQEQTITLRVRGILK